MSIFAERLKYLLDEKGLTQKQFAEQFSFSKNQVHYWLKNKAEPDMASLVRICRYFNVSADYLLGLTDM